MVHLYPMGILQGDAIWAHLPGNTGRRLIEMDDRGVTRQGVVAVLTDRVRAQRDDAPIHKAPCASTRLSDAGRRLRLSHQQTPAA